MHSDLWQRRIGWTCLAASILIFGAVAQQKHAAADDFGQQAEQPEQDSLLAQGPNDAFRLPTETQHPWAQWIQPLVNDENGKYWIGVESKEVPPELRDQL